VYRVRKGKTQESRSQAVTQSETRHYRKRHAVRHHPPMGWSPRLDSAKAAEAACMRPLQRPSQNRARPFTGRAAGMTACLLR